MFNDVTKYVGTLTKLNLTANQFLLCYLLYMDEKVDGKYIRKTTKENPIANLYKYASHNQGAIKWTKEEIRDIVDKGYLVDPHYSNDKSFPDYLEVTDKFVDEIFASKTRFDQFNDVYPALIPNFSHPNGPKIKLKVCDIEDMEELYNRKVKTKALHNKVLEVVQWAKDNKQLNTSMENFIRGNLWKTYQQQMEEHEEQTNMNIAT